MADIFISPTNIIGNYPKDLIERVESFFSRFLSLKINAVKEEVRETPLEEPQTSSCSESEADPGESALKIGTDSDTSSEEELSQSQQENPLYQALLACGTDPKTSEIMVNNYKKFPKPFCHSTNSIVSEY